MSNTILCIVVAFILLIVLTIFCSSVNSDTHYRRRTILGSGWNTFFDSFKEKHNNRNSSIGKAGITKKDKRK